MTKSKFIEWVQDYAEEGLLVEAALTGELYDAIGHIGRMEDFNSYCKENGYDYLDVAFDASDFQRDLEFFQENDLGYMYSLNDYEVAQLVRDAVEGYADDVERAIHSVTSNAPRIDGDDDGEEFWFE